LRGIQRLLCTLLCTRLNPYTNPVHRTPAPPDVKLMSVVSADECYTPNLFWKRIGVLCGNPSAIRIGII
jgi:hypothetical protein